MKWRVRYYWHLTKRWYYKSFKQEKGFQAALFARRMRYAGHVVEGPTLEIDN